MKALVRAPVLTLACLIGAPVAAHAQTAIAQEGAGVEVETNVIYGMYSGLALLMDVYRPHQPNGYGILVIPGSGWHAPLAYSAPPLKGARPGVLGGTIPLYRALTDAGYTLFITNHRAAPRFRYPDAVHDVQRATRFVRHHAARYGIDPERLAALGHSSGGHLASLLGTLDGTGDPSDDDPVNRESARVQAVVAGSAPMDLADADSPWTTSVVAVFLGEARSPDNRPLYREASPIHHISPDDAPFLLVHGDADDTVPFRNSERMAAALREAGVEVELIRLEGGGHASFYEEDLAVTIVAWLQNRRAEAEP